jgi:hypothetical protein
MKRLALLLLIVFAQTLAFGESFGMFGSSWKKVAVNQTVTANYVVRELMPPEDKAKLEGLLQKYERTSEMDVSREMDLESKIHEILNNYGIFEFPFSKEGMRELCTKAMTTPVEFVKSKQVKLLSLSFKHVGSKHEDWKDAFKGEKTHYCAVQASVDWQGAPSEAKTSFRIKFFDSNGLELLADSSYVSISRDNMVEDITLYAHPSYGHPVRFTIYD